VLPHLGEPILASPQAGHLVDAERLSADTALSAVTSIIFTIYER
jgi:hypothetical protein